jgi:hypothetical protein
MALQTIADSNAARLTLARAELTLSKVAETMARCSLFSSTTTTSTTTCTTSSTIDRDDLHSASITIDLSNTTDLHGGDPNTNSISACTSSSLLSSGLILSPAARALLDEPPNTIVSSSSSSTSTAPQQQHGEDDRMAAAAAAATTKLEAILRRATIVHPQTVQCMIQGLQQSQTALRELTPGNLTLAEFLLRCGGGNGDDNDDGPNDDNEPQQQQQQATLLYNVVREAMTQCADLHDYYSRNPLFRDPAQQRFSARTLPPFVDGYHHNAALDELSDRYWECESQIQRRHRESAQPIHPGFSAEMVAILCHAFEIGQERSPIGLNLFQVAQSLG